MQERTALVSDTEERKKGIEKDGKRERKKRGRKGKSEPGRQREKDREGEESVILRTRAGERQRESCVYCAACLCQASSPYRLILVRLNFNNVGHIFNFLL